LCIVFIFYNFSGGCGQHEGGKSPDSGQGETSKTNDNGEPMVNMSSLLLITKFI
jgi:hypothetical protein